PPGGAAVISSTNCGAAFAFRAQSNNPAELASPFRCKMTSFGSFDSMFGGPRVQFRQCPKQPPNGQRRCRGTRAIRGCDRSRPWCWLVADIRNKSIGFVFQSFNLVNKNP